MAINTVTQRNTLVTAYIGAALFGALYTTAPSTTAGTEVSGGSPAYARKSLGWSAAASSASSALATFDVPASTTVVGAGVHTAVTAGTFLDGGNLTSQTFSSQGTLAVTFTYTQS